MQAVKLREEVDPIINVSECDINTVYQIHFTCDQRSLAKLSWQNGTRTEPTQLASFGIRRSGDKRRPTDCGDKRRPCNGLPTDMLRRCCGPCAQSHDGARNLVSKMW